MDKHEQAVKTLNGVFSKMVRLGEKADGLSISTLSAKIKEPEWKVIEVRKRLVRAGRIERSVNGKYATFRIINEKPLTSEEYTKAAKQAAVPYSKKPAPKTGVKALLNEPLEFDVRRAAPLASSGEVVTVTITGSAEAVATFWQKIK